MLRHDLTSDSRFWHWLWVWKLKKIYVRNLHIMLHLFVKFDEILFGSFNVMTETRSDTWPLKMTLTLDMISNSCMRHIFSLWFIFLQNFIKFAFVGFKLSLRPDLKPDLLLTQMRPWPCALHTFSLCFFYVKFHWICFSSFFNLFISQDLSWIWWWDVITPYWRRYVILTPNSHWEAVH